MRSFLVSVFILSSIFIQRVEALSLFNIGKTCVFSEVRLQVLSNGEPVANALVTRQWDWNDRKKDENKTDENGIVTFPAIYESSVSRLLPTELVIGQQLSVSVNTEEKVIWTNSKREPEENSEFGGKTFDVVCELTDEEVLIEDYGSLMVTMCKLK